MTNQIHTVACKECGGEGGTAPIKRDSWGAKTSMRVWISCPECDGLGEIVPGCGEDSECERWEDIGSSGYYAD